MYNSIVYQYLRACINENTYHSITFNSEERGTKMEVAQ